MNIKMGGSYFIALFTLWLFFILFWPVPWFIAVLLIFYSLPGIAFMIALIAVLGAVLWALIITFMEAPILYIKKLLK